MVYKYENIPNVTKVVISTKGAAFVSDYRYFGDDYWRFSLSIGFALEMLQLYNVFIIIDKILE